MSARSIAPSGRVSSRYITYLPSPAHNSQCQTGKGDMLYISEIHSAVRSRVEQIHNISPEPRAQFAMSDRRGGICCMSARSIAPSGRVSSRYITYLPSPAHNSQCQTGKGDMLYISEIHSAVRSRVEQIHNISPEPRAQFAMSDRRGGICCMSARSIAPSGRVSSRYITYLPSPAHSSQCQTDEGGCNAQTPYNKEIYQ